MSEVGETALLGFTWDFTPEGREAFQTTMRAVSYSEKIEDEPVLRLLIDTDKVGGYWCYNCKYLKADTTSLTGYRCQNYGFPDRPWGCCAGQERK